MSLFASRLRKAEKLIAKGLFGQLFSSIIDTSFKQKTRVLKYKYLQKKYSAFIADKLNDKLRNGGGVKLLRHPISFGGCGFREKITRRIYASHVCVH